jgi:hypothetical protein
MLVNGDGKEMCLPTSVASRRLSFYSVLMWYKTELHADVDVRLTKCLHACRSLL